MESRLSPGLQALLREPAHGQLATLMPDGSPQITGEHILVNTAEGRQKVRNVRCDPRVAINVVDPANAWRLASIRGRVVDVTTEGADQLIDNLAKKYMGVESYPFRTASEVRLTFKIAPEKVNEMGVE